MATPESIGVCTCVHCKREVDAKTNSGGYAYYHCPCGHSERTHTATASRHFVAERVSPLTYGESRKTPEIPAKPAAPPAPEPDKGAAPAAKKRPFPF